MNIKKCSKCGWEYPHNWPGRTCKFCHGHLLGGYCAVCGEWSDKLNKTNSRCRKCNTAEFRDWRAKHRQKASDGYDEWLKEISQVIYPYKTLTEEQWLEACRYFGGCAYCGSESIDSRSMFIPFKDGGRYCAWNIIPACETCETDRKVIKNPFMFMNRTFNRNVISHARKYGYSLEKLDKITSYLRGKMNECK